MDDTEKADHQAHLRRMQSDLYVLESDRGRLQRKYEDALVEVKRIKNALARLAVDQTEKALTVSTLERDIALLDQEMSHHKKKMNAL